MQRKTASKALGLMDHLRYRIDRQISGGTVKLLLWLMAVSIGVVAVASIALAMGIHPEDGEHEGFVESFWSTLNLAMDPGGIEESGWSYRLVMILVSIFGILIVSTIIGVLTSGIEGKLEDLRRGRSLVIEKDHTIILGWSRKIAAAVQELVVANESRRRGVVVILADMDKVEMEDHVRTHVPDLKTTEVICRSGDPCDLTDLGLVRPEEARSILLFAGEGDDGDAVVFKRALALERMVERSGSPKPIVAEVTDTDNHEAMAGIRNLQVVKPADLVTRVLIQAARQPGLSRVYEELLSFEGCEIYFHADPALSGRPFRDASMVFATAAAIGILRRDGQTLLNPDGGTMIEEGDALIVVAGDDSEVGASSGSTSFDSKGIVAKEVSEPIPNHYLVIGWHQWADILLRELDALLAPGSKVDILYDPQYSQGPADHRPEDFSNISVSIKEGKTTRRSVLQSTDLSGIDQVLLLAYREELDSQSSDSHTLLTLVNLRSIVDEMGCKMGIATELVDAQNRALAQRSEEDDFIASEELVSDLMVQLSESPTLYEIFGELLTADGAEIHLRNAAEYVPDGVEVPFGAIVQEGLERNECVIGTLGARLELAVDKSKLVSFGPRDSIVVLADD